MIDKAFPSRPERAHAQPRKRKDAEAKAKAESAVEESGVLVQKSDDEAPETTVPPRAHGLETTGHETKVSL